MTWGTGRNARRGPPHQKVLSMPNPRSITSQEHLSLAFPILPYLSRIPIDLSWGYCLLQLTLAAWYEHAGASCGA